MSLASIRRGVAQGIWEQLGPSDGREQTREPGRRIPNAAYQAADDLIALYEVSNGESVERLYEHSIKARRADQRRPSHFGWLLAAAAMGVKWAVPQHKLSGELVIPRFHVSFDRDDHLVWEGEAKESHKHNPAQFTAKGERMYEEIKKGYGADPRASEIAARTVYARHKEGGSGLVRMGKGTGVPNCGDKR